MDEQQTIETEEEFLHRLRANPFKYSDADLYRLMKAQGDRRFGSECKHEQTRGGYCVNCLRKVIDR